MSEDLVECEGHGQQKPAFVCQHLAESQPDSPSIGFIWNCEGGDLLANCEECEAEAGDDGFLPDDYFEENFVVICRECFVEMAAVNSVSVNAIEHAERASESDSET